MPTAEETPTLKTWAKGIESAWKAIAKDCLVTADDAIAEIIDDSLDPEYAESVYQNVSSDVGVLDAFIRAWIEDAKINKGLWVRTPDKSPRGQGIIKTIEKAMVEFRSMLTAIEDVKSKLTYDIAGFDANNDKDYDRQTQSKSGYEFRMRGMGHRLKELVQDLTKQVTKVTKLVSEIPDKGGYIPSELDLHGAKLVFQDSKHVIPGQDSTKDTHPYVRELGLEASNTAYTLLRRRGLDFLWYGQIFFIPKAYAREWKGETGSSYTEGAHYEIRTDKVRVILTAGTVSDTMARFIAHELGHRFWFKYMDLSDRAEFADKFLAPGTSEEDADGKVPAVTEYGGNNAEEDFAEVFAHYVDGKDLTRDQLERFRKYIDNHKRKVAAVSEMDLEEALDELAAPIRLWVHRPDSEGKQDIADVYGSLSEKARDALAADVLRVCPVPFTAYRRIKGSETLKGLDSVTTDKSRVDHAEYREYLIHPKDVLVHWKQDTPLGKGNFAHEKEVILKPGVSIQPVTSEKKAAESIVTFPWDESLKAQHAVFEGMLAEAKNAEDPSYMLSNAAAQVRAWIRAIEVTPFQWNYHGADISKVKTLFMNAADELPNGYERAQDLVNQAYDLVFGRTKTANFQLPGGGYALDDVFLIPSYPQVRYFPNHSGKSAEAVLSDILSRRPQLRGFVGPIEARNDETDLEATVPVYEDGSFWFGPAFYSLGVNAQDEAFAQAVAMSVGDRLGWDTVVVAAREAGIDPWDVETLPFGADNFKASFAKAFSIEVLYPGQLSEYPKWQRLVGSVVKECSTPKKAASTLTPEWAERKFVEHTKTIWSDKTYDTYIKTRLVFSDEAPAKGVLASVMSTGTQMAIGRSLLKIAPKYTVRFAPRFFELPEAQAEGIVKHEVIHLGYPRHDANFRSVAKEVGAPLTENESGGGGFRLEVKDGARFKLVKEFETIEAAKKHYREIMEDKDHDLYGKKFRVTQ